VCVCVCAGVKGKHVAHLKQQYAANLLEKEKQEQHQATSVQVEQSTADGLNHQLQTTEQQPQQLQATEQPPKPRQASRTTLILPAPHVIQPTSCRDARDDDEDDDEEEQEDDEDEDDDEEEEGSDSSSSQSNKTSHDSDNRAEMF
jgi:hypothetical protein